MLFWNNAAVQWLLWSVGFCLMVELLFDLFRLQKLKQQFQSAAAIGQLPSLMQNSAVEKIINVLPKPPYCVWKSQVVVNVSKQSLLLT